MTYRCENQHEFEHTGKLVLHIVEDSGEDYDLAVPVCPICSSRIYSTIKPSESSRIISVRSVALEEVDAFLAQGYDVEAMYAKTATLVKRQEELKE